MNPNQQQMPPPLVPMMSDPQSTFSNHQGQPLRMKTAQQLHMLQHNPSYVPNAQQMAAQQSLSIQQQERMRNLSDVAAVEQQETDHSEMKSGNETVCGTSKGALVTTDYDDDILYMA